MWRFRGLTCQENPFQVTQNAKPKFRDDRKLHSSFFVVHTTIPQRIDKIGNQLGLTAKKDLSLHRAFIQILGLPKRRQDLCSRLAFNERFAISDNLGRQILKAFTCEMAGDLPNQLRVTAFSHSVYNVITQHRSCTIFHFGKQWRHASLQRKTPQ